MDRSKDIYLTLIESGVQKLAELFKKANIFGKVLGIHLLFNGSYIITLYERHVMLDFADLLENDAMKYNVSYFSVFEPENVVVTFKGVHTSISPEEFAQHIRECYNLNPVSIKIHMDPILGIRTDTRYAEFQREEFYENPMKSFIDVGGDLVWIKYKGQVETCRVCDKTGHRQDSCPVINAQKKKPKQATKEKNTTPPDTSDNDKPTATVSDVNEAKSAKIHDVPENPSTDPVTPDDVFDAPTDPGKNSTPLPDKHFRSTMSLPPRLPHHLTQDNSADWSTVIDEEDNEDEEEDPSSNIVNTRAMLKRKDRSPEEVMDSARFKKLNS